MKTQIKAVFSTALPLLAAFGTEAQIHFDFSGGVPAGTELFDSAQITGGVLHLTDAVNGLDGHFRISNLGDGKAVKGATFKWRSLIGGGGGGGADGYSLNWAADLPETPAYFNPGEEGAGSGLTVTVDTFDNGGGEAPGIDIRWQSNQVAFASIPKDDPGGGATFLRKNVFVDAEVTISKKGEATFTYDGVSLTAALDDWKGIKGGDVLFSARTGGANDNHWIDELDIATGMFTAGAFNGLFADAQVAHEKSGFVSLKLSAKGAFSGYIIIGGKRFPIRGAFSSDNLTAAIPVPRPGFTTATVELRLTDRDTVLGRVTDGIWTAPLEAKRQIWNKKNFPAIDYAASYTAIVAYGSGGAEPHGYGYGTLKVDPGGMLKFVGKLADGSAVAQTVPIAPDGRWAFFGTTHRGKGSIQGWVPVDIDTPRSGPLTWFKDASAGGPLHPDGFKFTTFVVTSPYVPPGSNQRIVAISDGHFDFEFGNLALPFSNDVLLTSANKIIDKDDNRFAVKFKPATGAFSGSVNVPNSTLKIKFAGVVSQGIGLGAGHFLGQTQSGRVLFLADPP